MTSEEPTTAPIRWGIVATGGIATKFVTDLRLVPDAAAVAVASRSDVTAQKFAAEHGIPHAYGNWLALAEDPEVDIVYVAGPHPAHHPAARLMLAAGKAVLCEKPITLDTAQADDLVAVAHEHRVFLAEAMWMRTIPAVRQAVELAASGAIGQVAAVTADFSFSASAGPEHRIRNPELGGGALLDVGIYPLAFAQLILGNPDTAAATARLWPEGTDAATALLLGYTGGPLPRHAALTCASDAEGPLTGFIYGTEGHIALDPPYYRTKAFSVHRERGATVERHEVPYDGNGLRFPAIEAGRCLREGLIESPLLPHADTLAVMRAMDAIRAQIGVRYPHELASGG